MALSPDPPPWPDGSAPPQTYEFATASLSGNDPYADISGALNAYGAQGWALVATEGRYLVFQRPMPPPLGR